MEKDKKNNVVLLSVIGVLVVILIAIVVVILVTKKDNTGNTEGNNPSGGQTETPGGEEPTPENPSTTGDVDTVLSNYNVKCEMPTEGQNPKITYYENLKTDGDRVLTSQSSAVLEYSTEAAYEAGKQNPEYQNGKFDDEALRIEYILGTEVDYTKSDIGDEVTLYLSDYQKSLEDLGYTCK